MREYEVAGEKFILEDASAYAQCVDPSIWPPPPEPSAANEANATSKRMRDQQSGDWYWEPKAEEAVNVCMHKADPSIGPKRGSLAPSIAERIDGVYDRGSDTEKVFLRRVIRHLSKHLGNTDK